MRAVVVFLALSLTVAAGHDAPKNDQKIVGGTVTTIDQYPFGTVMLRQVVSTFYAQACGGSIINNRAILSAAHCYFNDGTNQWQFRIGSSFASSGGTVHTINRIIMHPNYQHATYDFDVAIIHSTAAFTFGKNVRAGSIAGSSYNLADNQAVWAIGWGTTSYGGWASEVLREVELRTVNQATCGTRFAELGRPITDNMLCAGWIDVGGRDQCYGDSGGPVLHNNVIVGICSFGHACAHPRYPGVNTRVSRFTSWIQANA